MGKMSIASAIGRIRSAGHDISDEYSQVRCIEFLNTAVQQVSSLLIAASWPSLVKEITVRDGDSLPDNFMRAAGSYPLRMTDGRVQIVDDSYSSIRFRYFAAPPQITATTQDLPYEHDGINDVIVRSAVILALNENEYDVSADSALVQSLQQAIASGISG